MTSEPTTAAGRALAWPTDEARAHHSAKCYARMRGPAHAGCSCGLAEWVIKAEAEARAAAERDVVALRRAVEHELRQANEADPFEAGCAAAYNFVLSLLADTVSAEPRWPSGPDAERELAAALRDADYDGVELSPDELMSLDDAAAFARALIAALQEKRDPGE